MKSSVSSARAMRWPPGDDSTGLLATVISAFTCPGPAVSISSASSVIGSSPNTSGAPLTRLLYRAVVMPGPTPGLPCVLRANAAERGNIAPPGSSRWPVSRFSTSISHEATVPWRCVQVPMRP
jgi:hypothetical protein